MYDEEFHIKTQIRSQLLILERTIIDFTIYRKSCLIFYDLLFFDSSSEELGRIRKKEEKRGRIRKIEEERGRKRKN